MRLSGADADSELTGDLFVRVALDEKSPNFELSATGFLARFRRYLALRNRCLLPEFRDVNHYADKAHDFTG